MKFYHLKLATLAMILFGGIVFSSCDKDEPEVLNPIASFQYEVSAANFNEVAFSNFSQNATSYLWAFGDGETSTEKDPVHTFVVEGEYTVMLTATGDDNLTASFSQDIIITDPNAAIKSITGETSKVWKLSRNVDGEEFPIQVGPNDLSEIWWALGVNDPLGARPCIMEEEYIFNIDGSFTYDSKGSVFADFGIWNTDVAGQCVDETVASNMTNEAGEDISAWGSGNFTFDFNASANTLTVEGLGAHIGLPKVSTTEEVSTPQNSVTYKIVSLETDGPVDKMVLQTQLTAANGYWQMFLVSYDNPADEPDLAGAAPTTSFDHTINGATVTFTNSSINADSYMWDFGDGNMSFEESPVHTYDADGSYTVKLTATNADGSNEATANVIISTNVTFSLEVLNGGGSKSWKLSPTAGALSVGPAKASGEWFATSLDDVTVRDCTFDDTYTFDNAGGFTYNTNGDLWAEAYMGVMDAGCINEADLPSPAAPWGSGSHTFTLEEANGSDPAYLTVKGTGAFIALPKAFNGGEYADANPEVDGEVRYEVLNYVNDGSTELLILTIDISEGQVGGAYWTYTLQAE